MAISTLEQVGMDVAADAYHAVSDIGADFPELLLSLAAEEARRRRSDVVTLEDLRQSARELAEALRVVSCAQNGRIAEFADGLIELLQRVESR